MKKILTLIALSACTVVLSAQEAVLPVSVPQPQQVAPQSRHFGYLSYNDVLHAMPEYEQAMKSLADLTATYQQEMERAEQEFSKKFAEYIDGQQSFPENIMLKRQKELQQLMEQSMKFKQDAQELLTKAEAELMAPIRSRLSDAITAVGKRNSYAYVLNTDANAYPYISDGGEAEDCTDAVLTELGIQ